jgi:hypothetical protein
MYFHRCNNLKKHIHRMTILCPTKLFLPALANRICDNRSPEEIESARAHMEEIAAELLEC